MNAWVYCSGKPVAGLAQERVVFEDRAAVEIARGDFIAQRFVRGVMRGAEAERVAAHLRRLARQRRGFVPRAGGEEEYKGNDVNIFIHLISS